MGSLCSVFVELIVIFLFFFAYCRVVYWVNPISNLYFVDMLGLLYFFIEEDQLHMGSLLFLHISRFDCDFLASLSCFPFLILCKTDRISKKSSEL